MADKEIVDSIAAVYTGNAAVWFWADVGPLKNGVI
jgi:hypothetical protein